MKELIEIFPTERKLVKRQGEFSDVFDVKEPIEMSNFVVGALDLI
jgi:hypothetical protein